MRGTRGGGLNPQQIEHCITYNLKDCFSISIIVKTYDIFLTFNLDLQINHSGPALPGGRRKTGSVQEPRFYEIRVRSITRGCMVLPRPNERSDLSSVTSTKI